MKIKIPKSKAVVRTPTKQEKLDLLHYIVNDDGDIDDEVFEQRNGYVEDAAIAVIDNYHPDSPGYSGKVMIVIWSGGIELTEVFHWYGDGLYLYKD